MTSRRRIWQLDPSMHCSVLGTCLSLHDLHVVARRVGCKVTPSTSAYTLHAWFVDQMATANEVSKLVDKTLEKRHHAVTRAVRQASTAEELEARWKDAVASSHLASAYWAAMSHALCTKELQWKLFGDIHMLSHLVGSSRRSDLGRLQQLETTCAATDGKLAQLQHDHRAVLADNKRLADAHEVQRRELDRAMQRLTTARVQHYRALVERRGGELVHHDGGLEESPDGVTRALATVDTVLCPVDCVSHAAYFKVKRACKHLGRPLVLLRTSGLSAFARALDAIAAAQPAAEP